MRIQMIQDQRSISINGESNKNSQNFSSTDLFVIDFNILAL